MKILMFGRGVISATYGWALERAGHEIVFYVRPGRAASYGNGIDVDLVGSSRQVPGKQVRQSWPVRYIDTLEPDHDFDLIILSVSHERLPEAVAFLAPRLGGATLLIFGNVWTEPRESIGDIPLDRIAWGFPGGGGGFGVDGVLRAGLLPFVVFGTLDDPPSARERAVRSLFRVAGFRIQERPDFRAWLWIHFVADAGIHSQGLRVGSLSRMVGATADLREALLTIRELLPLLTARGIDLRRHRGGVVLYRAPSRLTSGAMSWAMRHIPTARRSMEAHTDPDAPEPRAICRDTLAEARRLGIPTPRLEAAEQYFTRAKD